MAAPIGEALLSIPPKEPCISSPKNCRRSSKSLSPAQDAVVPAEVVDVVEPAVVLPEAADVAAVVDAAVAAGLPQAQVPLPAGPRQQVRRKLAEARRLKQMPAQAQVQQVEQDAVQLRR